MGDWQKRYLIIVGLLGFILILAWGMVAQQDKYDNQYALECVNARGNALLDVKGEIAKAEERLSLDTKAESLSQNDRRIVETSVAAFVPMLTAQPSTPNRLCPDHISFFPSATLTATLVGQAPIPGSANSPTIVTQTPLPAFQAQPLNTQVAILNNFINTVEPEFDTQKESAKPQVPVIFTGLLLQLLVSFFLTALINRIAIRKWGNAIATKSKELIEQYNTSIKQFPYDEVLAILTNHPMGKDLKRDLDRLDQHKYLQGGQTAKTNWFDVSRTFFKAGYICRTVNNENLEHIIKKTYLHVRKIVSRQIGAKLVGLLNEICFLLIFLSLALVWSKIGVDWFPPWIGVFGWLFGGIAILIGVVPLLEYAIRWFTEKTWDDFDDLIVGIVGGPTIAVALAYIISRVIEKIPPYSKYFIRVLWEYLNKTKLSQALITVIIGWLLVFFLNKVIVYALLKWSERTEQKYDDMFVRIVQVFGTFILIAITFGVLLANFQSDIARVTGVDNVLLPYSIIVSVFSAVLGYASREAIENFFGGILLQVDRPFNIGERLKLESGEICDVREVGMRSTVLYNILESTEISIPNSKMSTMKVTNISRPDYSLRITTRLSVPNDGTLVKMIELILLDIGYLEGEVDEARVADEEVGSPQRTLGRRSLIEELSILSNLHPQILNTVISRIEGGGRINEQQVFPQLIERMERIRSWRVMYSDSVLNSTEELRRASEILEIATPLNFQSFIREFDLAMYKKIGDNGKINSKKLKSRYFDQILVSVAGEYGYQVTNAKDLELIKNAIRKLAFIGHDYRSKEQNSPSGLAGDRWIVSGLEIWIKYWEINRMDIVSLIASEFNVISELITAIANNNPLIRPDMDRLFNELSKEPTITSNDDAVNTRSFINIDFNFFSTFMERQHLVLHKVNKAIRRRLWRDGIAVDSKGE